MDSLLDGELVAFEKWFIRQQQQKGHEAQGLLSVERGVIKAFIVYAATKEPTQEVSA